jgi:hypothetical protein
VNAIDRDLLASAAAALMCAAVVVLVNVDAIRAVFAVPLCLILPGYAITVATFVRPRLGGQRTVMLTPALSLATLVLGALLLDAVPGGLRLASWTILLLLVVLGACAVAGIRRGGRSLRAERTWRLCIRSTDALWLVLALVGICGALALSRWPLPGKNASGYAQMWMLSNGTPAAPSVQIGVASNAQHPATYRIALVTGSGKPSVVEPSLTLAPGQQTAITVPLTGIRGPQTIVTAELFKDGLPGVYRRVSALISPPPGTQTSTARHQRRR